MNDLLKKMGWLLLLIIAIASHSFAQFPGGGQRLPPFKIMGATALKVRVLELDVRINPNDDAIFSAGTSSLTAQANMYKYVVNSFMQNVPAAQRHGFTIWGVTDSDSWIITSQKKADAPLLFDNNYGKKPAFYSVLLALKGK